jgi:hypothetical protein
MFQIKGKLTNSYSTPPNEKNPDERYTLQVLGDVVQRDGQTRQEVVNLRVPFDVYRAAEKKIGQPVTIPVGVFASQAGRLTVFFPSGVTKQTITTELNEN